jgi:hypothetical protein
MPIFQFSRELPRYLKAKLDHPSNGHRLFENTIPDALPQAAITHHIYLYTQKLFKLLHQNSMLQESRAAFQLNQEINVAMDVGLASGHRSEDAHIISTMLGSD